jgi:hypothetical protein
MPRARNRNPAAAMAYDYADAAEMAGMGQSMIREAVESGLLPARKHGRRVIILAVDLQEFLRKLPCVEPKWPGGIAPFEPAGRR